MQRSLKPNYEDTLKRSIRKFMMDSPNVELKEPTDKVITDLASQIMLDLRDAGLIVALEDGTDYAHRS